MTAPGAVTWHSIDPSVRALSEKWMRILQSPLGQITHATIGLHRPAALGPIMECRTSLPNLILCRLTMQFSILPQGTPWPSGDYYDLAVINVTEAEVKKALGVDLLSGDEPGMGPWRAIAVSLKSGSIVEFISYDLSPTTGFTIRADVKDKPSIVLKECLTILPLHATLDWVTTCLAEQRFT